MSTPPIPPHGTLVNHGGIESVFVDDGPAFGCRNCAYMKKCKMTAPLSEYRVELDIRCGPGVYLPKTKYMQLKLVGEVE